MAAGVTDKLWEVGDIAKLEDDTKELPKKQPLQKERSMLIQNYGLYWKRDDVFWGRPGTAGRLLGHPARSAYREIDFRLQRGVYCLYDESFKLVYVGQAGANDQNVLFDRLKQHQSDALADRWSKFSWFGILRVLQSDQLSSLTQASHSSPDAVMNHIEAILIAAAEPPINRQGGRFGEDVHQYLQKRDAEMLGKTTEEMIRDIWTAQISN